MPRNPLPQPLTPLVGRKREVDEAGDLLLNGAVRLLTLTGPGGIGKTRLAVETASQLAGQFRDGAVFVPLAPVAEPDAVMDAISQALDVQTFDQRPVAEHVQLFLQDRELLLLVDNFEHVVEAAPDVAGLLRNCPGVKVLATSRMPFNLTGEQLYPVPPLAQPASQTGHTATALAQVESVQLFVQRAKAADPRFQLTDGNASAVAEICSRLEGLPLAIELAAPVVKILPPAAIVSRLDRAMDLLVGGPRDLPPRQRALRATVEWSYELLDETEQRLFRRLSVFASGCSLDAIAAVCESETASAGSASVLELLSYLVDKSLVVRAGDDDEPRFTMLETIREYALEQLEESGEADRMRHAHAGYYLALAEAGEKGLQSAEQLSWLRRLAVEQSNLRAAHRWALATGSGATALRLCGALWRFWVMRSRDYEGRRWVEETLDLVDYDGMAPGWAVQDAEQGLILAKVLAGAGQMAFFLSDFSQATEMWEQCLALSRRLGTETWEAYALNRLAAVDRERGDYTLAHRRYDEALAIYRRLNDPWGIGDTQHNIALTLHYFQDDHEAAMPISQESLAVFRTLGSAWDVFNALHLLGYIQLTLGNYAAARLYMEESQALAEGADDRRGISRALLGLGDLALKEANHPVAAEKLRQSLSFYREVRYSRFALVAVMYTASLLAVTQPEGAARLLGASVTLQDALGIGRSRPFAVEITEIVDQVRVAQDPAQFDRAWQQGAGLSITEAVDLAMDLLDDELSSMQDAGTAVAPSPLTTRELEVLKLVADGLTDAQVAEKLVISPRTVNSHLTSIFNKLGVSSRMAAVRAAQELKLL